MKCAVLDCKSNNKKAQCNAKFYRFPQDEKRFQQWIAFCGRKDMIDFDKECVCNFHFAPTDFERDLRYEMGFTKRCRRILLPTAIPTIRRNTSIESNRKTEIIQQVFPLSSIVVRPPEASINAVENELDTDPLLLEIKVEPEMVTENYEQQTAQLMSIKSEPEDQPSNEIESTNEIKEDSELHPMQIMRNELKMLRKENAILRKAARQHVLEIANINRSLKKSEFLRLNVEKNLRLIFTEGQIKKLKNGPDKRLVWSDEDLGKAAELYSLSRRAYELLQKNNHPLPSIRTIQHWVCKKQTKDSDPSKEDIKTVTERVLYKNIGGSQISRLQKIHSIKDSFNKDKIN